MMQHVNLRGIFSAVVTPFDAALLPDSRTAIPYYRDLLSSGCDGLNILGTTGEAMSVGIGDRLAFMEAVSEALPRDRLIVGTGAAALDDAARLTRAALELRFAAALIIPPFYFRDVGDEGIVRFFDALFSRVDPPPASVVLYNFPRMSGITLHADLVDQLIRAFPGTIAGVKDSSNTLELEREIHARHPDLAVFPGSEALLGQARADGFAGCISGSVCLWPQLAARAWREGLPDDCERIAELRESLSSRPLIQAVRLRIAQETRDPSWLRTMPPV
jgi:4-hydroxy-tetrahydrodipicolinate synthase